MSSCFGRHADLWFLRVLRLLRLFRFMRYSRIVDAFATMVRVLQSKRVERLLSLRCCSRPEPSTSLNATSRHSVHEHSPLYVVGSRDHHDDWVRRHDSDDGSGQGHRWFVAFTGICAVALPVGIVSSGFIEELTASDDRARPHQWMAQEPVRTIVALSASDSEKVTNAVGG
jgi:hypothetical protein